MEKLQDMLKPFSGHEGEDVSAWLKKVKLVARLKKIDELSSLLPLYLESPAFAVFDQMTEENQAKSEEVEKVLMQAFALNAFSAFDVL